MLVITIEGYTRGYLTTIEDLAAFALQNKRPEERQTTIRWIKEATVKTYSISLAGGVDITPKTIKQLVYHAYPDGNYTDSDGNSCLVSP